jgi:flavorubredoxin
MQKYFKAEQISANVWWVGAVDWNVRNFHGYLTGRGSTYNAYLIIDDKVTLVDTVKAPFAEEMLARIRSVIDPGKIDYIISNHAEPDHSGALPAAVAAIRPEKIFTSVAGAKTLSAYYGDLGFTPVKTGDAVELGQGRCAFVDTKMLHWPDSMVTFYDRDKVLFSQDAFGMHLAGSFLWADQYEERILEEEVRKYFANILNLYSEKVIALLDSLPGLDLGFRIIAPDHGPVWRKDLEKIVAMYRKCAEQKPEPRAVVVYCTMWGSTKICAEAFADGVRSAGVEVETADLLVNERSSIMSKVARAGLIAFGAPTMNNQVYPAMADVMNYVKGLRIKNKLAFAFGSCGWSGEGAKQIAALFDELKLEQPLPFKQVKYMPQSSDLEEFFKAGVSLAEQLLEKTKDN